MGWLNNMLGGGGGGGSASGNSPQDSTPEYGAFSVRGLTSSDQANYARNQAAAKMYANQQAARDAQNPNSSGNGGYSGIASLAKLFKKPTVGIPNAVLPNTYASDYTGSSEVSSMLSALSSMPGTVMPEYQGYGASFQGMGYPSMGYPSMGNPLYANQPSGQNIGTMSLMDVFSAYPNLAPPASGNTGV